MTTVRFEHMNGTTVLEADPGHTLMAIAVRAGVPGIRAECGGSAACATCHMYVEDDYLASVPPASEIEEEMLEEVWEPRRSNSRLGCQVEVQVRDLEIRVVVPEAAT